MSRVTRILAVVGVVLVALGRQDPLAEAFSPGSAALRTPTTSSSVGASRLFANSQQKNVIPRPPNTPPPLEATKLEQDYLELLEQSARIQSDLNQKIEDLNLNLVMKKNELNDESKAWNSEKTSLMDRIAELTAGKSDEQKRLEREVKILQDQVVQVRNLLKAEQKTAEALRERLDDVNDQLEFQQMEYEKERAEQQTNVDQERQKLEELQRQFEKDRMIYDEEKEKIRSKLEQEVDRLKKAEIEWKENRRTFEDQNKELSQQLTVEQSRLADLRKELKQTKGSFEDERQTLQEQVKEEQTLVKDMEKTIDRNRVKFEKNQAELEARIREEQKTVKDLSERLVQQQLKDEEERTNLQCALDLERERILKLEEQLKEEQTQFAEQERKLQAQIEKEIETGRRKKKEMHKRYEKIRTELTELWEGAKREAREEVQSLTDRYEGRLAKMNTNLRKIEDDLMSSRASNTELKTMLDQARAEAEAKATEMGVMEDRYIRMVSERNDQIASLKVEVDGLSLSCRERDQQIERYETSFRAFLGLSVKVTGNKLKKGRQWLGRRHRKKE